MRACSRKRLVRAIRMDRRWTKTDSLGIVDTEAGRFCEFHRPARWWKKLRCRFQTSRIARLATTTDERCLLRLRRRGRSGRRRREVCLRCGFRCGVWKWGSFGFRRSGQRGWRVKRREKIIGIECGFNSFCESALGGERFAEDCAVGSLELKLRGNQLGVPAERACEGENLSRKKRNNRGIDRRGGRHLSGRIFCLQRCGDQHGSRRARNDCEWNICRTGDGLQYGGRVDMARGRYREFDNDRGGEVFAEMRNGFAQTRR